jgi:4-amino-4-deoxy-L-arabinose transferase-like glycosyltransferase
VTATEAPMTVQEESRPLHRSGARLIEIAPAVALLLAALPLRFAALASGVPPFDSDEATMGVMALHIRQGADPIFFYGQAYMGSMEAYLAALSFQLFGVSVLSLRLGLLLLDALFLLGAYLLIRLLYGLRLALLSVPVLALGSQEILSRQLKAVGGYPESLLFGTAVLLFASWPAMAPPSRPALRRLTYALCGLSAGLGLWSDPIVLPFVVAAAALLVFTLPREHRRFGAVLLGAGFLLGAVPLVLALVTQPLDEGPAGAALALLAHGGTTASAARSSLLDGIVGTVVVSVPVLTGGNGICTLTPANAWPLTGAVAGCSAAHAVWGVVVLSLLGAGITVSAIALRRSEDGPERARILARLALVSAGALTLLLYALSPAPRHSSWFTVRYLTCLWIVFPALLAPLLLAPGSRRRWLRALAVALALVLLISLLNGFRALLDSGPPARAVETQRQALVSALLRSQTTRMYSDYWTCNVVTFLSRERVQCAVLNGRLQHGVDRYPPYRVAVERARSAADVFPAGSPQARTLSLTPGCSRRAVLDGYDLFAQGRHACRPSS